MHAQEKNIARIDRKLEKKAESAQLELSKLRWHWTLNPENPDRMSFEKYAKLVERSFSVIRVSAKGYEYWMENSDELSLTEAKSLSAMSDRRRYVAQKVAEAYNVSVKTAADTGIYHKLTISLVEEASRKTDTLEDFKTKVDSLLEFHITASNAREAAREEMAKRHGIRFVGIENELTRAQQSLLKAIQESHEVEWTDQERQIIVESIRKVTTLTQLLDMAITGSAKVDWDAELQKLGVA